MTEEVWCNSSDEARAAN